MSWGVRGTDYLVWRRMLEISGDQAMATRLDAIHAAEQSGCKTTINWPAGKRASFPLMIVSEGAFAARQGRTEAEWRLEWFGRLMALAVDAQDEGTSEGVAVLLAYTDPIVEDLKYARVWPWLGQAKPNYARPAPAKKRRG